MYLVNLVYCSWLLHSFHSIQSHALVEFYLSILLEMNLSFKNNVAVNIFACISLWTHTRDSLRLIPRSEWCQIFHHTVWTSVYFHQLSVGIPFLLTTSKHLMLSGFLLLSVLFVWSCIFFFFLAFLWLLRLSVCICFPVFEVSNRILSPFFFCWFS